MKISELFKLPGNDVTKNFGYKLTKIIVSDNPNSNKFNNYKWLTQDKIKIILILSLKDRCSGIYKLFFENKPVSIFTASTYNTGTFEIDSLKIVSKTLWNRLESFYKKFYLPEIEAVSMNCEIDTEKFLPVPIDKQ